MRKPFYILILTLCLAGATGPEPYTHIPRDIQRAFGKLCIDVAHEINNDLMLESLKERPRSAYQMYDAAGYTKACNDLYDEMVLHKPGQPQDIEKLRAVIKYAVMMVLVPEPVREVRR